MGGWLAGGDGEETYRGNCQPIRPITVSACIDKVLVCDGDSNGKEDEGNGGEDDCEDTDNSLDGPFRIFFFQSATRLHCQGTVGHVCKKEVRRRRGRTRASSSSRREWLVETRACV